MARLNRLEDIDFPVSEHPVVVMTGEGATQRRISVRDKKGLVNDNSQRVLGIVSKAYRLVSNTEAIAMAYQCCETVFPETSSVEWEINHVDAPSTAGYCHFDLVHKTSKLDFQDVPTDQRPDLFGPFIRVTNSYNGQRALGFDIGFYRKVCKNGLILPQTIIRFKFSHLRKDIGMSLQFLVEQNRLAQFKSDFTQSMAALRACTVERSQFERLVCVVLQLNPPKPIKGSSLPSASICDGAAPTQVHPEWHALQEHLSEMSDRYANELGSNAYAAFNAVTEFASRPLENRCVHRDRHSLQRLAGTWLAGFNTAGKKPGFSFIDYLQHMESQQHGSQEK